MVRRKMSFSVFLFYPYFIFHTLFPVGNIGTVPRGDFTYLSTILTAPVSEPGELVGDPVIHYRVFKKDTYRGIIQKRQTPTQLSTYLCHYILICNQVGCILFVMKKN